MCGYIEFIVKCHRGFNLIFVIFSADIEHAFLVQCQDEDKCAARVVELTWIIFCCNSWIMVSARCKR